MTTVEFVIIGFPKCETTSLVDNLNPYSVKYILIFS